MYKRFFAILLSAALVVLSPGLEGARVLAQTVSVPRRGGRVGLPSAPMGRAAPSAGFSRSPFSLPGLAISPSAPAPGVLPAPAAVTPVEIPTLPAPLAGASAEPMASQPPRSFETMVRQLAGPSPVGGLPADAPTEERASAAREEFRRRIAGQEAGVSAAAVDPGPGGPSSHLNPATGNGAGVSAAVPRVPSAAAQRGQRRSVMLGPVLAAVSAAFSMSLQAVADATQGAFAAAAGGAAGASVLAIALSAAAWAGAGAAAAFAAWFIVDAAAFITAMVRGRGMSEAGLARVVQAEVDAGRLDPGVGERVRPYRSRGFFDLTWGLHRDGLIYVRPQLAATPFLLRAVLAHELSHLKDARGRGPPPATWIKVVGARTASEMRARLRELRPAKFLRSFRIAPLERALPKAEVSLRLSQPYDILVLNPTNSSLGDSALYGFLSEGTARPEVASGVEPAEKLRGRSGDLGAVVLDRAWESLPGPGSREGDQLDSALRELDALTLLASRGEARPESFAVRSYAKRFRRLALQAQRRSAGDRRASEKLERQVRQLWKDIAAERIGDTRLAALITALWGSLRHKGLAFLPFGPNDPGVEVFERLLRAWDGPGGGRLRVTRVDLEDGGHILVARKLEARVGLWIRPPAGRELAASISGASDSRQRLAAGRRILTEAGLAEELAQFDQLGVEVRDVYGADVGRREIYVTIPRRNAWAVRGVVEKAAMLVEPARADFEPHLLDAAERQGAARVWEGGITGAGGQIFLVGTGGDAAHQDFGGRLLDVVDRVAEGPEDWNGHETVTTAIAVSDGQSVLGRVLGMARQAFAVVAKVFSRESPGAVDGDIKGSLLVALERGADVINLSLGSRGHSGDDLARFLSDLTLRRNSKGDQPIVTGSFGNAGPFDRTGSQPAVGVNVIAVAAAARAPAPGTPRSEAEQGYDRLLERLARARDHQDPAVRARADQAFDRLQLEPAAGMAEAQALVSHVGLDGPQSPPASSPLAGRPHYISFYSSVGPDMDPRSGAKRVRLKPDLAAIGGDVVTDPGDADVYKHGVLAAKSKNMPHSASDSPDHRHTRMSGTSMAAPMTAGIALLVKQALRLAGFDVARPDVGWLIRAIVSAPKVAGLALLLGMGLRVTGIKADIIREDLPLAVKAILMRTSGDMGVPVWLQGAGLIDAGAAVRLIAESSVDALNGRLKAIWGRVRGGAAAPTLSPWAWIERYREVVRLEDQVYAAGEIARGEAFAQQRAPAAAHVRGNAVHAEAVRGFQAEAKTALPRFLELLADPVWLVRRQAALALLNLKDAAAAMPLAEAALNDADPRVREMAFMALANLATHAADELLLKAASDPRPDVALYSAYALARHGDPGGIWRLEAGTLDPDEAVRVSAVWLLGQVARRLDARQSRVLAARVRQEAERGHIRHRAAAALFNMVQGNPAAVADEAVVDLLEAGGPQDLALTRTISRFFSAAVQDKDLGERLKEGRVRAAAAAFVERHRAAGRSPGGLGEMVRLLAKHLGLSLDVPTPLPHPGGAGVHGVDPVMGPLDLIVEAPASALPAADLQLFHAVLKADLPSAGASWVSVPGHKLFAFTRAMARRGIALRRSRPLHALGPGPGLALHEGGAETEIELPGFNAAGASEARVMAALETTAARLAQEGRSAAVVSINLGGRSRPGTPLARLVNRLILGGLGVVAGSGNEGPLEGSVTSPADSGLAVAVAAAGAEGGVQSYSGRTRPEDAQPFWAQRLPAAGAGTGAAARQTARALELLYRRLAAGLTVDGGRVPDGAFLYLTELVGSLLGAEPGRGGPAVFDDVGRALHELESRLADPWLVRRRIAQLAIAAREKREAPGAIGETGKLDLVGRSPTESIAPTLGELRAVLSGGVATAGAVQPFRFKVPSGDWPKARSAGLEGFYFSKLEHERGMGAAALSQVDDYFRYLDGLLKPLWAAPIRESLRLLSASSLAPAEKNAALNRYLSGTLKDLRARAQSLDSASWLRGAQIYAILARSYNRLGPGKNFLDSLDDAELVRIQRETSSNTIWLLDIFEIGEIRRWGTGGGSPYAIKGYRVKPELGGDEGFRRFAARAHALGMRVAVDVIPNHLSLDSDFLQKHPEGFLHIVPPQPSAGEDIEQWRQRVLAEGPREQSGNRSPVLYPILTRNYPGRVGQDFWILVHHPRTDYGDVMWVDMAQRDFSQKIARDWETGEVRRLFAEMGVDLVRRDMAYYVLNAGYHHRWMKILEAERDSVQGWARVEMDRLIRAFESRWLALGGAEFLQEMTGAAKQAKPSAALIDELYGYFTELSPHSDAGYNKNDHDLSMGQEGLYDRISRGDAAAVRRALRRVAFSLWQRGGAGLVHFFGNHDESNPVDKFSPLYRAAVALTLFFRPTLVYAGFERGVGQREGLIGDLSRSTDLNKDTPFDIPVLLDWSRSDPGRRAFLQAALGMAETHADVLRDGALEVLEPEGDSPIAAWSASHRDPATGAQRTILVAANLSRDNGSEKQWARLPMDKPLLIDFGAFRPRPDRTYRFIDRAEARPDGSFAEYNYTGQELLAKGLSIGLPPGGVHLFKVEELEPAAPPTGPPAVPEAGVQVDLDSPASGTAVVAEAAQSQPPQISVPVVAVPNSSRWDKFTQRLVNISAVLFSALQVPQIILNLQNIAAGHPEALKNLPWEGYTSGMMANMLLLSFFVSLKDRSPAIVQAVGILTSAVVVGQIFFAGLMPFAAVAAIGAVMVVGFIVNLLKWRGRLPETLTIRLPKIFGGLAVRFSPWTLWERTSVLLGLFALPVSAAVTFGFGATLGIAALAGLAAALGGAALMALQARGKLPAWLSQAWVQFGAWLATLLFVLGPVAQHVANWRNPAGMAGIAVGTLLIGTLGNLMMLPRAMTTRNRIWFIGSTYAVVVGGMAVLASLYAAGVVGALLFWPVVLAVPALLLWSLVRAKNALGLPNLKSVLSFLWTR